MFTKSEENPFKVGAAEGKPTSPMTRSEFLHRLVHKVRICGESRRHIRRNPDKSPRELWETTDNPGWLAYLIQYLWGYEAVTEPFRRVLIEAARNEAEKLGSAWDWPIEVHRPLTVWHGAESHASAYALGAKNEWITRFLHEVSHEHHKYHKYRNVVEILQHATLFHIGWPSVEKTVQSFEGEHTAEAAKLLRAEVAALLRAEFPWEEVEEKLFVLWPRQEDESSFDENDLHDEYEDEDEDY